MVFFPTYSYEQYYQAVAGIGGSDKNKVQADIIYTEGTAFMMDGLRRKRTGRGNVCQTDRVHEQCTVYQY